MVTAYFHDRELQGMVEPLDGGADDPSLAIPATICAL